jgi:hypothetical protein
MSKTIVVTVPHALGKEEARRRVASEIEQLKAAYIDKFAHSEVTWTDDVADIRVVALAQEVKAHIVVDADSVHVEILLPWILASLAGKVESQLTTTAQERLALPPSNKG